LSCVVKPLCRPCDADEPAPALGSEWCTPAGAVLCVVGVVCGLDVEPLDVPGAVLWVVGVGCAFDAGPLAIPVGVPCGAGVGCASGVGSLAVPGVVPCGVCVGCAFDAGPVAVPGAVPFGAGAEVGDDWDAVPLESVPWLETAPDGELPTSA